MPAAPIVGAVVAVAVAAEATTTAVAVFATIAAIGSAAAAVGQIAGVKELALAGTILGAVGAVGGLASAAGLFGEAASFFGNVTNAAGGAAAEVAPMAVSTEQAIGAAQYTPEALQALDTAYAGTGSVAGGEALMNGATAAGAGGEGQIVDMIAGRVGSVTPATVEAPVVSPAENVSPVAAVNEVTNPEGLVPNPAADTVVDPTKALIDQQVPAPAEVPAVDFSTTTANPAEMAGMTDPAQVTDPYGQAVAQNDPARAYADGTYDDGSQMWQGGDPINGSPAGANGSGTQVAQADASKVSGRPEPVAGQAPAEPTAANVTGTTGAEANASGFGPGQGPKGPADLAARNPDGTLAISPWRSVWDFIKNNDKMVLGALQAGGSLLNGAMSPLTPAQVEELNARAEANRAVAAMKNTESQMLQRRMANANQKVYARFTPPGLINQPVTGRPA